MTFSEVEVTGQKFKIGRAVITRSALAFCEDREIDYLNMLMRHAEGDFGDVGKLTDAKPTDKELKQGALATSTDLTLNAVAIKHAEGMVMSVYPCPKDPGSELWIQTLLAGDETYTTVLLPSEY